MTALEIARHVTPLGAVSMALCDGALCALAFDDVLPRLPWLLERRFGAFEAREASSRTARVARALDAYFAGDLHGLAVLTVDPGGTLFQRAVWNALRAVPAGETVSYAALARGIGRPDAARAVGAACGANPIWLVVPCHRAIGSDGRHVGYAGGLERKGWLLQHEQMAHGVAGRPRATAAA
jgi:methylated-DNA-[protein]-cysteine S-methyltransferase